MLFAEGLKDSFGEQPKDEQSQLNTSPEQLGNTQNRPKLAEKRKITPKLPLRSRLALGVSAVLILAAGGFSMLSSRKAAQSANLTTQEIFANIDNPDKSLYIGAFDYDPIAQSLIVVGRPLTSTTETQNKIYRSKRVSGAFAKFEQISGPSVQNRIYTAVSGANGVFIGGEGDPNITPQAGLVEHEDDGLMGSSDGLHRLSLPENPTAYTDVRNIEYLSGNSIFISRRDLGYEDSNFIYDCTSNLVTATQRLTYTGASASYLGSIENETLELYAAAGNPDEDTGVVVKSIVNRNTGSIIDTQVLTRTGFAPSSIIRKWNNGKVTEVHYLDQRADVVGIVTSTGNSISKESYRSWVNGIHAGTFDNSLVLWTGAVVSNTVWYGGQITENTAMDGIAPTRPIVVSRIANGALKSYILDRGIDASISHVEFVNEDGLTGLIALANGGSGESGLYFIETNSDGSAKDNAMSYKLGDTLGDEDEATPTPTSTTSPTPSATGTPIVANTPTATIVMSATAQSTATPSRTPTSMPSSTSTSMPSSTPTLMPSSTPSKTPTSSITPTATKTGKDYKVFLPVATRKNSISW